MKNGATAEVIEGGWTEKVENAKDVTPVLHFQKVFEALGNEKELHIMRGLVTNVEKAAKEGTGEIYYMLDLKVLKKFGNDSEYGQSYNLFNIVVPTTLYKTDDDMREMKGNEVTAICSTRCSVRPGKTPGTKFNSISFFVQFIELTRVVNNTTAAVQGRQKL